MNKPRYELHPHAGTIDYASWLAKGIKMPLFDKDGTLTHVNSLLFVPDVIKGLRKNLVGVYPRIAITSNNPDAGHVNQASQLLEEELGIEVFGICVGSGMARKPRPDMGHEVANRFDLQPDELGVVGDRRFTDVLFGQRLGAGAIALCEKAGEGDARWVPTARRFEAQIVNIERLLQRAA